MTSSILFLVDHKHRDLPTLALIGYILKQNFGIRSLFCALNEENYFIQKLNPGFIVIPKANYDFAQLLKFREEGRRIIVMDTEGNPQEDNYKVRILLEPDLYLFWNESYMRQYKDDLEAAGVNYVVLGCPRTDFLSKKWCLPLKVL